jgi:hypothetical protein
LYYLYMSWHMTLEVRSVVQLFYHIVFDAKD